MQLQAACEQKSFRTQLVLIQKSLATYPIHTHKPNSRQLLVPTYLSHLSCCLMLSYY